MLLENQAFNRKPDDDTKNVFVPVDEPFRLAVGGKERLETWGMLYCGAQHHITRNALILNAFLLMTAPYWLIGEEKGDTRL
jgi:hypothetical protein